MSSAVANVYSAKDPTEILAYGMDFTNLLVSGETIATATVVVSTYTGTDASPTDMYYASADIASAVVTRALQGGLNGVTYRVLFTVVTSVGRIYAAAGYLPVDTA
jgi:hypothetical protein